MVTYKDLRIAIVSLIRQAVAQPLDIHFNHVDKSNKSYVFVEVIASKVSLDAVYYQRTIDIDLQFVMIPPEDLTIKRNDLMEIAETLDQILQSSFKVSDRYLTVINSNFHIFDEILHYEFTLNFTDAIDRKVIGDTEAELMRELDLKLKQQDELIISEE